MTTQRALILRLLEEAGPQGITPLDALQLAGCFRLAARIKDLRTEGWDIRTELVTVESGKRIARYTLIQPGLGL